MASPLTVSLLWPIKCHPSSFQPSASLSIRLLVYHLTGCDEMRNRLETEASLDNAGYWCLLKTGTVLFSFPDRDPSIDLGKTPTLRSDGAQDLLEVLWTELCCYKIHPLKPQPPVLLTKVPVPMLKHQSLEQRKVYCRARKETVAHALKSPELPKRFQQSTLKSQVREGVARSVITLCSFLSLADGEVAGWCYEG